MQMRVDVEALWMRVTTVSPMKRGLKALETDPIALTTRTGYNRFPDEKGTESA